MIKHGLILLFFFLLLSCDLNFYETTTTTFDDEVRITHDGRDKRYPAWSPDGSKIAYSVFGRDYLLMSYNYLTDDTVKIGRYATFPGDYDLSPDQSKILYSSGDNLITMNLADGSIDTLIAYFQGNISYPQWSDDGQWIVFGGYRNASFNIWVAESSGAGVREITKETGDEINPSWSPDGEKVAYNKRVNYTSYSRYHIFVVDMETGISQQLTQDSTSSNRYPDWSPDGTTIAYESSKADTTAIWTMKPDGSNKQKITRDVRYAMYPAWSPDGTKIACRDGNSDLRIYSREGEFLYTNNSLSSTTWYDNYSFLFSRSTIYSFIETFALSNSATISITPKSGSVQDLYPIWFPDGSEIIYIRQEEESGRNYYSICSTTIVCNREKILLPLTESSVDHIAISPDGNWLLFEEYGRLYVMPYPSGKITDLTQYIGNYLRQPAWNPISNGAVCRTSGGLLIIEVDSNLAIRKSFIPGEFSYPDWSIEVPGIGSHIVANSGEVMYIISPDGSKIESAAYGRWPTWSPDGRQIAFIRYDNEIYIKPIFIDVP